MALSDVAAALTTNLPHQVCGVCYALAEMSEGEAATLRGLLANRGIRYTDLADALEADPDSPTIPHQTLSRHASGGCSAREKLRK